MKKLITMVVLLIFILLLTSCNGSDLNGSDTSQGAETTQGSAYTTGSYSAETNSSVLKAWTGEFSEDKLKAAINEYQSSYHNIVFAGNGEGAHIEAVDISFETDFEVSLCSVSRLAPVDDTDINVELNGYIDLALIPDCDGKRVTVDAGWWHGDDDWVQSYPVWSYLVRLTDADDTVHYYYFRVDYSTLGAALTDNEINVKIGQ
ncbi:MAG: hypothetical protein IKC26_05915 [Clostridia bacterium]|nr:hypothetical protein [Clostridia bacterium]